MLGAQPESIFMHASNIHWVQRKELFMRVAKKRRFARPQAHAFLRLNEDAKRPPGVRDTPFIDEDGHLSGLLKIYMRKYQSLKKNLFRCTERTILLNCSSGGCFDILSHKRTKHRSTLSKAIAKIIAEELSFDLRTNHSRWHIRLNYKSLESTYVLKLRFKRLCKVFKEKVNTFEDDNSGHFKQGERECCVAETVRILKRNMGRDRAPIEGAIRKLVRKVREKGMLVDDIILRLF
ncbi:hypothetical protein G5I_14375 [Acromyrmex echinatior]|uniref:DUF4817 domain-containing protein n=1 Tax=Acromyrmex echinatior TaxID=103372 RepID=F4X7J8_ACREC|nr:hypothetical protein G5I_14375 [Acromyrmex echinatior]